jgi:hypothetical protein
LNGFLYEIPAPNPNQSSKSAKNESESFEWDGSDTSDLCRSGSVGSAGLWQKKGTYWMPGSAGGYRQENEAKIDSSIVTLLGHGNSWLILQQNVLNLFFPFSRHFLLFLDDYTIITKILSGKSLIPARAVLGVSNPYVDIRITPPDRRFGDQLQRSSYKPLTVNPIWTPYERFQHTTNIPDSKIVFSL